MNLEIAVAVILDDALRMLLVRKRDTEAFIQPGGKIEEGETPMESLCREVNEELGVDVAQAKFVRQLSAPAANEPGYSVIAHVFSVELSSKPIVAAEIDEMSWCSTHHKDELSLAPLSRMLIDLVENGQFG